MNKLPITPPLLPKNNQSHGKSITPFHENESYECRCIVKQPELFFFQNAAQSSLKPAPASPYSDYADIPKPSVYQLGLSKKPSSSTALQIYKQPPSQPVCANPSHPLSQKNLNKTDFIERIAYNAPSNTKSNTPKKHSPEYKYAIAKRHPTTTKYATCSIHDAPKHLKQEPGSSNQITALTVYKQPTTPYVIETEKPSSPSNSDESITPDLAKETEGFFENEAHLTFEKVASTDNKISEPDEFEAEQSLFNKQPIEHEKTSATIYKSRTSLESATSKLSIETFSNTRQLINNYQQTKSIRVSDYQFEDFSNLQASIKNPSEPNNHHIWQFNDNWNSFIQLSTLTGSNKDSNFSGNSVSLGIFSEINTPFTMGFMLSMQNNSSYADDISYNADLIKAGPFISLNYGALSANFAIAAGNNNYTVSSTSENQPLTTSSFSGNSIDIYGHTSIQLSPFSAWPQISVSPFIESFHRKSNSESFKTASLQFEKQQHKQTITRIGINLNYLIFNLNKPTNINFDIGHVRQQSSNGATTLSFSGLSDPINFPKKSENEEGHFVKLGINRELIKGSSLSVNYFKMKTNSGVSSGWQFSTHIPF